MVPPRITGVIVFFVLLCFICVRASVFVITPTRQALVLRFGEVMRMVSEPGLHFKTPFLQNVQFLDRRVLGISLESQEVIASDQKRLIVDAFARYRIADPVLFFQTVRTEAGGGQRLITFLQSSLRAVVADASFSNVVRDKRAELMEQIRELVGRQARKFGVEVIDVRIRRADLPTQNSQAVFQRMQTERQKEAAELRAQGAEESQRIRAKAKAERAVILAKATRDAEKIKGEGEATRSDIFAKAVADPEFYAFYRSLQAYEQSLKNSDTRFVLSPISDFFRFFSAPATRGELGTESIKD